MTHRSRSKNDTQEPQERHTPKPSTGVLKILNVRSEVGRDTFLVCQPFDHALGVELCSSWLWSACVVARLWKTRVVAGIGKHVW